MVEKKLHHGKIEIGFMAESDRHAQSIMTVLGNLIMAQDVVDSISVYRQVKEWREVP